MNYYYYCSIIFSDPRVTEWFLMKRWTPIIIIISTYFIVVLFGPRYMQNRPPYTLRTMLKIYNLVQVIISAYMFKEVNSQ